MAAPQKRKCEDMNASEMTAYNSAMVHGVFAGKVPPVKCSRTNPDVKHFLGQFSDGKKAVHNMMSFKPKLRRRRRRKRVGRKWHQGTAAHKEAKRRDRVSWRSC